MRLATFNMRGGGTQAHWGALLDAAAPDVLFAQESKDPAAFPDQLFETVDYARAVWAPVGHGRWGSALYAPAGSIEVLDVSGYEGWVTGGTVAVGEKKIACFSVHVPEGEGTYVESAHRILDRIAPLLDGTPTVLAGDWNLTVGSRHEDEEMSNRPGELELLDRFKSELGLVSAWPAANPEQPLPQTLRWVGNPVRPYHCDGVFVPREWQAQLREVTVLGGEPWTRLSDHNPVVAVLDGSID
jgi:endonuclease/exonuclease/phosphatase family metal-dependent hydrolase